MKVGFGSKPKGKKKGGKGKKGKKDGADAMMADAAPEAMDDAPSNGAPLTAKEKQRRRMALKKQLKVKVAGLKAHRCASVLYLCWGVDLWRHHTRSAALPNPKLCQLYRAARKHTHHTQHPQEQAHEARWQQEGAPRAQQGDARPRAGAARPRRRQEGRERQWRRRARGGRHGRVRPKRLVLIGPRVTTENAACSPRARA